MFSSPYHHPYAPYGSLASYNAFPSSSHPLYHDHHSFGYHTPSFHPISQYNGTFLNAAPSAPSTFTTLPSSFASDPFGVQASKAPPAAPPVQTPQPEAEGGHSHYYRGSANEWCGHAFNTLGYWKCRGLAAPIRMMLAYQGVPYENKFYDAVQREDGTWDRSEWLEHKESVLKHNNPLINLPYLESVDQEGGIVLAQSNAILNHLGRRFNLTGCTEIDAAKADMLMEQCADLRKPLGKMFYSRSEEDFTAGVQEYFQEGGEFDVHLQKFEDWFAAQGAKFLVEEDHPIMADFVFWEILDVLNALNPGCFDKFQAVKTFYDVFRNLPQLQGYFESDLYKLPFNGRVAIWGGN